MGFVNRKAVRLTLSSFVLAALGVEMAQAGEPGQAKAEIYLNADERNAEWHAGWADAVISGDLVFVSGIIAALSGDENPDDTRPAFERAFERLRMLLEKAGAGFDDVVDLTAYLTDVERDTPVLNKVRLEHMRPPYAASTVVQVVRLIPPRAIGELRVIARRKSSQQ